MATMRRRITRLAITSERHDAGTARPEAGRVEAHRWKVLGVGVAANGSFAAALTGLPAAAVLMRSDYRLELTDLGWVIGAMGLGLAVSELLWGMLTDRWGDRKVLLTGLGLTSLVLALMALFLSPTASVAPSAGLLGGALLLVGVIGGSLNGSSGRAVMAWFGEGERGLAMSIRQMALPAGGAAGALLLPALAESVGFRGVYGALAAMCLVTTGFVWLWLREPPFTELKGEPAARLSMSGIGLFRNSAVWRTVFGLGALCIPQIAVVTFAAVFLNDALHLGTTAISAIIVAIQFGAAVARVWSGRYTDRRRNRRPFLKACALLTAAVYGALALLIAVDPSGAGHDGTLMLAGVGVFAVGGIVASSWHGIAFTELATIVGITHTGAVLGLGNTFAFGTYFLTPLAIPHLLDQGGWGAVWMACALAALLAFTLFPKAAATR